MKLTVVTPSYNQGKYIRRTINSVLSQNYSDIEYIVMDGGSTDETVSILEEYGDQINWESKRDKGQADAVNKGIKKASGEIIGWLNSDDIYYPGCFETVMRIFKENPNINVVYGNAYHIDENDNIIEEYYTEDFNFERLKEVCFICQPALFFRKKIVNKYGYLNDKLKYCMDYEYWIRLGQKEKFLRINQFLAGSRLYAENKTLGSRRAVHEEICAMLKDSLGRTPSKWIFNLAHVLCEETGIDRNAGPEQEQRFIGQLLKITPSLFWRYNRWIGISDLKILFHWKRMYRNKKV